MTLVELAKELQDDLVEGIQNFIIYKEGKQWKRYGFSSYDTEDFMPEDEEDKEEYNRVKSIDHKAIIVNGYNNFPNYTLQFIQYQIKNIYNSPYNV